jgi:SAM-dependent methyltransferase
MLVTRTTRIGFDGGVALRRKLNVVGNSGASGMAEGLSGDYWAAGELESPAACPACGGQASQTAYDGLLDHLEGVPGRWGFRRCLGCRSLFLDPRPTPAAIGKAYASETYFTHMSGLLAHASEGGDSLPWRLANGYLNSRYGCARQPASAAGRWLVPLFVPVRQQLDYFYRHLPSAPGSILDVGCGNGAFLLRAKDAGWQVQGVEPDGAAASRAREAGLSVHAGGIGSFETERTFDVVTLSHVFEHLHEPRAVLQQCRRLLRPGGRLWMSMPNQAGIGHRIYRAAWFPLDPPRHLLLPSPQQLVRMCEDAGFARVRLLRRGRSGARGMHECAARAAKLGVSAGPAGLWRQLIDLLSSLGPRWAEELIVVGYRDAG